MGAAMLAGQCWEAQHGTGTFLMLEMAAGKQSTAVLPDAVPFLMLH